MKPKNLECEFLPKEHLIKMKMSKLGVSVKNRNEYSDFDYLHKLDKESLNWLKKFHREYNNADFKHENCLIPETQRKEI